MTERSPEFDRYVYAIDTMCHRGVFRPNIDQDVVTGLMDALMERDDCLAILTTVALNVADHMRESFDAPSDVLLLCNRIPDIAQAMDPTSVGYENTDADDRDVVHRRVIRVVQLLNSAFAYDSDTSIALFHAIDQGDEDERASDIYQTVMFIESLYAMIHSGAARPAVTNIRMELPA